MIVTDSWINPVDGDYTDGADWSTGAPPLATDYVDIEATGSYTVSVTANERMDSLNLSGGGTLEVGAGAAATVVYANIASDSSVEVDPGATLKTAEEFILSGSLSLGGKFDIARGYIYGGGTISLAGRGSEIVVAASADLDSYLGSPAPTIQGAGEIALVGGVELQSEAIIDAFDTGANLTIEGTTGSSTLNPTAGALEATNGGRLVLEGAHAAELSVGGAAPLQAVGTGSRVELSNVSLNYETISASGGGVIDVLAGGATLEDAVLTAGAVRVTAGATLSVNYGLENDGVIDLGATGEAAELLLTPFSISDFGTLTAYGSGTILMGDDAGTVITDSTFNGVFDNDITIAGAGQIGAGADMGLINQGVIDATGDKALVINVGAAEAMNEAGSVFEASGAGGLLLGGGVFDNLGTITALGGGSVTLGAGVALTNNNLVEADGGDVTLSGYVRGVGTLEIFAGSTLEIGGAVANTQNVVFAAGTGETLKLDTPATFVSPIGEWAIGDTIDLAGDDATSAAISGDTLTVDLNGGGTLSYTLNTPPSGVTIGLASDGDGGTDLSLSADAPAVARLAQAMAALPSAAPANDAHPTENAVGHLALIAASRA
jgi:hypothetical protein